MIQKGNITKDKIVTCIESDVIVRDIKGKCLLITFP